MQGTKLWFKTGKLWFKMSVEDTMRLIKEDHFRETMQEEMVVAGNVVRTEQRRHMINPGQRNPSIAKSVSDQGTMQRREWENKTVLDEEQSLFLAGEQVTNVDDDVDDSQEHDLALNVDHIFELMNVMNFDSDVDEGALTDISYGMSIHESTEMQNEENTAQILLSSTVDHYKSKTKEVTLLKKDFKQKEDKFLEEFLDLKKLKDKIEDRLYKQDQSVQTVHMLCKPKSFYDEKHKVAIGYKNPVCLARAKQAQPALYNGHVLVTTNHTPPVIHDSEDTHDNNRKKAETLAPKPISALTVYPPNTPVKLVPRILPTKSKRKDVTSLKLFHFSKLLKNTLLEFKQPSLKKLK
ncbi:hypothetical protein Tco_0044483 [Tanacetum coccineum]